MRHIAVLTSGGDAPGMNAAIRAAARGALDRGWKVTGVRRGYAGLLASDFMPLTARDVGGIMQRGGTMLGTARAPEFASDDGRQRALANLEQAGVDALVVIGGNGSQSGAFHLHQGGFPVVGVASTIDNDLYGAEITIGVDTALNIALEAIDRLKVTASSHQRAMLVEVMGRDCGYLALMAGIAGGAEAIVIPEREMELEAVMQAVREAYRLGKAHALIVVAEGARNNAEQLAAAFKQEGEKLGFDLRVTKLGHVQRGGTPGAFDRLLATRTAAAAVETLAAGQHGVLLGLQRGEIAPTPLGEVAGRHKQLDLRLFELARVLSS